MLYLIFAFIFLNSNSFLIPKKTAQISKLVIEKGKTYKVAVDNILLVDTLILKDKSTIQFLPDYNDGVLKAKVAYVGKQVTIRSKARKNQFGVDGSNLILDINFATLGSLIVDTGGTNENIASSNSARNIGNATKSRRNVTDSRGTVYPIDVLTLGNPPAMPKRNLSIVSGGSGGDITLYYSTNGFIPNFNRKDAPQSIILLFKGGVNRRVEPKTGYKHGTVKIINKNI